MTKGDLIETVARAAQLPKKSVTEVFDLTFEQITRAIRRERRFSVPGFGTFSVRRYRARPGYNPRLKAPMTIPAIRTVGFRPSPRLKKGL
jgi:DNA-binding protein HU-beta